jgi:hypothetical protein
MILYEAWYGRAPAVAHLRVFDCLCFVKELNQVRKLDDRSRPGMFLGYADGAKAYRIYYPVSHRVLVSCDVVFDEMRGWNWSKSADHAASLAEELVFDYELIDADTSGAASAPTHSPAPGEIGSATSAPPTPASPVSAPTPPTPASAPTPASPASARTPASRASASAPASPASVTLGVAGQTQIESATALKDDEERLDASYAGEPLWYWRINNILSAKLHTTHAGKPTTHAEAQGDPAWREAMQLELESIESNRTWELVDPPAGHRPISLKWVFKLKKDEKGAVIKHKARLVARGFVQQEGIDYDDAFTPMARMESVHVLLALAAQEGWSVHHMDVMSAFLNGDLK